MTLLRRFLSLIWCQHQHRYKEQRAGVLTLVCDRCDQAVPAIARTNAERRKMLKQFRVARPAKVHGTATVRAFKRGGQ